MAAGLGINIENIVITSVIEGSVIISYNLIVDENSVLGADDLKTLSEIMIANGAINLGGDLLNFEQGVVTDENGQDYATIEEPEETDQDDDT